MSTKGACQTADLPLAGVRVIDVTLVWAGPFASMILGDLGAEVIRVENIHHFPPSTRGVAPKPPPSYMSGAGGALYPNAEGGERPWNRCAVFNCSGRNKLSMTLDPRRPKGKQLFKKLVAISDILIENNAYGVMERLGWGYKELKKIKPDLIMISMPAFGNSGPYKELKGFGAVLESLIGHTYLRGYPDLDPTRTGNPVYHADASAGAIAAFAALVCLYHRHRCGEGQFVDLAQAETILAQLGEPIMEYTMNGLVQQPRGNRDAVAAPQGCWRCRGEDKWINISVCTDEQWRGLCKAMGEPPWSTEQRFADSLGRWHHHKELDDLIGEWTGRMDIWEVTDLLQRHAVPAGPVLDEALAFSDPHLQARRYWVDIEHQEAGTHPYPGFLWRMSATPPMVRKPSPCLGEHNDYVYRELLGLSRQEIDQLEKEGHIGYDYVC